MASSISDLRRDYTRAELSEAEVHPDAIEQFRQWFDQALESEVHEPTAMTLATATAEGVPSARIVLLKGIEPDGFVFYTDYRSRKGRELEANPHAALVFFWPELERQVRVTGTVRKVAPEASDAYYRSRPLGSRLSAWASRQSEVLSGRAELEERLGEIHARYGGDVEVPRPPYWGGFLVEARTIEFWQGRPSRLHDRLRYVLQPDGRWTIERLSP